MADKDKKKPLIKSASAVITFAIWIIVCVVGIQCLAVLDASSTGDTGQMLIYVCSAIGFIVVGMCVLWYQGHRIDKRLDRVIESLEEDTKEKAPGHQAEG